MYKYIIQLYIDADYSVKILNLNKTHKSKATHNENRKVQFDLTSDLMYFKIDLKKQSECILFIDTYFSPDNDGSYLAKGTQTKLFKIDKPLWISLERVHNEHVNISLVYSNHEIVELELQSL